MYNLTIDQAHTFFVGEGQWLVHNACRVYRIEGSINQRLIITPDGNVRIVGDDMLFLNFGDELRAEQFYLQRLSQNMPGLQFKTFLADDELLALADNSAVPQSLGRLFPNSPQLVDVTKASYQFGFPYSWFETIEDYIIQGTGYILK